MPFHSTGPHYCPHCRPGLEPGPDKGRRARLSTCLLELIESNYSGCGVDMASCPRCRRVWQVSYKVDQYVRVPEWEDRENPPAE